MDGELKPTWEKIVIEELSQLLPLPLIPVSDEELKKSLTEWVESYKDVAERNALAETPEESADYLISLMQGRIEQAKQEERERFVNAVEKASIPMNTNMHGVSMSRETWQDLKKLAEEGK